MGEAVGVFGAATVTISLFGGIALIIWASTKARIARIMAEVQARQTVAPLPNDTVLMELKAIQQQMAQMQSTGHQFDLSFDAALERLEGRVGRLETKSAASTASETPQTLRNGLTP